MPTIPLFKSLPVAIALNASVLCTSALLTDSQPATAQSFSTPAFPTPAFSAQANTTQPLATPTLTDIPEQLASPNIDVSVPNTDIQTDIQVILVDPVEQSYFDIWEQTATTQLSDINIRSAVQAPITQIQIRAGRLVIEQLGDSTTESFFFNTTSENRPRLSEFSDLPDGNYRVLLSNRGIEDGGRVTDGRLFTFRKSGSAVTGNFDYVGSGESACVTGTLEGNTVFGQAFANRAGTNVLGKTYLGPGLSLQLSNDASNSAVLDLNGFSLVKAGTVLPPTSCQ